MKLSLRGRGRRLHDNDFLFAEAAAPAARTASNYGEHDEQDDADNNARNRSRVDFAAIVIRRAKAIIITPHVRLLHDNVTTSRVYIAPVGRNARKYQSIARLARALQTRVATAERRREVVGET
jgi:hypothetical protein